MNTYKMIQEYNIKTEQINKLRERNFLWSEIATFYQVSQRTTYRWTKLKEPIVWPKLKRGVKSKVTEEVASLLRSCALEKKARTQQAMADYVYQELGIKISRPSINAWLKKLGIAHKKLTYHYTQLDEEKAKAFNEEIKPLLLDNVPFIALDECSFYPNLDPRYGYALKSERAIDKRPSHKGKHYTLLFAISNSKENGVVHWKLTDKKVDWEVFYNFLEEINSIGDKKNYLIMDNARIHTAPRKREKAKVPSVIEQMFKKNIEVKFVTKYAPMLNPTELVFNLFRQQTEKQRPRNYEEMENAIKETVKLLNTKDLSKYFWHCANYFDNEGKNKLKVTDI